MKCVKLVELWQKSAYDTIIINILCTLCFEGFGEMATRRKDEYFYAGVKISRRRKKCGKMARHLGLRQMRLIDTLLTS